MPTINKFDKVYPALFSAVLLCVLISFISSSELSLSTISTNFRWRKNLIEMYTTLRFKLGDHVYNGVVIGKGGWFFYTSERSIDDYQKVASLNKKISYLQIKLDKLNTALSKQGITLLVVIPPNKSTIYPQYMPVQIPVIGQKSRLDQFVKYMKDHDDRFVLDLRSTLLEASRTQNVYYKTDTHWNDVGAYYGYVAIMHTLTYDYPFLTPHRISEFEYKDVVSSIRDLSSIMGLANYKEESRILVPKFDTNLKETSPILHYGVDYTRTVTNGNNHLLKLLVFHDSFYTSLSHFIEPHFGTVVTIPYTNVKNVWSLDWIEREKPDIVIIEVVERYLDVSLPVLLDN